MFFQCLSCQLANYNRNRIWLFFFPQSIHNLYLICNPPEKDSDSYLFTTILNRFLRQAIACTYRSQNCLLVHVFKSTALSIEIDLDKDGLFERPLLKRRARSLDFQWISSPTRQLANGHPPSCKSPLNFPAPPCLLICIRDFWSATVNWVHNCQFVKISTPLPLKKTYRMKPLSARFISMVVPVHNNFTFFSKQQHKNLKVIISFLHIYTV